MAQITKDNLFRPTPSKAESKSEETTRTVKAMLKAEVDSRETKTARLRKARLAMEAEQTPAPPKTRSRKAAKPSSPSVG